MICPLCSNSQFKQTAALKTRLIEEWELKPYEVDYLNKQQGLYCTKCNANLRSMTLAYAILKHYSLKGNLFQNRFTKFGRKTKILEINEAGKLHNVLNQFKNHEFAEFPKVDIQKLPYNNNLFDLVIHSDTLEHVENTLEGLKECYRVLVDGGSLFYTIPIVYGRMTRGREGLKDSFHGTQEESQGNDYKVWTEYGADFWIEIIQAGFTEIRIYTLQDLASIAICANKQVCTEHKKIIIASLTSCLYFFKRLITKIKCII